MDFCYPSFNFPYMKYTCELRCVGNVKWDLKRVNCTLVDLGTQNKLHLARTISHLDESAWNHTLDTYAVSTKRRRRSAALPHFAPEIFA